MRYVKSVKLNGKPYTKAYINYMTSKMELSLHSKCRQLQTKKGLFNEDEKPYSLSK
jgi:hypothetical protein